MGVGQRQLKHERLTSFETPTSKAAFQLKQVTRELGKRPLAAYDRGTCLRQICPSHGED